MSKPVSRRLSVEPLEGRDVPANNVGTLIVGNTLFLIGDAADNGIILSQPNGAGTLRITPTGITTVNGMAGPVDGTLPANLVIRLGAGNDSISFDLGTNPILIQNALTIDYGTGGTGTNTKTTQTTGATGNGLTVGGNFGIRYAAGNVSTVLDNLEVDGGLTVLHGVGDSALSIDNREGAGNFSTIGRGVFVRNVQGVANNTFLDTNIGGNVTIINGRARATDNLVGFTQFATSQNPTQATITGNLFVSTTSGDSGTGYFLSDLHVTGNVTLAMGSGQFNTSVLASNTTTAPVIDGRLKVTAGVNGQDSIHLGSAGVGLVVKKGVTVRTGNRDATVTVDDLTVTGPTSIFTGAGMDTISIDGSATDTGSTFNNGFTIGTAPGADTVNINSGSATTATTTFNGLVSVSLGIDNDTLNLATAGKVNFANKVPLFDGRAGANTKTVTTMNLEGMTPVFRNFM
jgi:hypothetical protein